MLAVCSILYPNNNAIHRLVSDENRRLKEEQELALIQSQIADACRVCSTVLNICLLDQLFESHVSVREMQQPPFPCQPSATSAPKEGVAASFVSILILFSEVCMGIAYRILNDLPLFFFQPSTSSTLSKGPAASIVSILVLFSRAAEYSTQNSE